MSTRISVDAVSAVGSLSAFQNAIRGTSSAWRAQEVALKNSGKYTEAAATRYRGLNKVIDLQKAKIEELRSRQEGLNTANEKQAGQYLKLESQIQSANKQLASYESQMDRAKNSVGYYASGLGNLQHQMKLSDAVSRSYVAALRAQGKTSKADRAEFNGLRESLSNLEKQQAKQQFLLKQVANQSGKTSDAYRKQQIELNRTSESIAKTKTRMEELNKSLNPPRTNSWGFVRNEILRVDEAEKKARTSVINYGQALKANILGGWISSGLTNLTTGIKGVITNGMAAAKVGAAMEARWKNIGLAAGGVKQLSTQVGDLKTNTYLSAQSVNALQTRFYGMTHSIQQAKVLTQSVGSLTDKLKLSEQQSNAFAGGLARIESSGKVSSRTLGRLEKQAPGLTAALQKASGMSKKAFSDLLSSGKMTADQFNQLMIKASGDYKQNAKAFSQTSGGAMHKLRAEWVTTQAKLAKPLLKVSSTGLNELSKALNNKDTQRGLQMIAKGMANVAVDAAKFIGFLAKHQTTVKVFGTTILGLAAAFKTMQGTVMAVDVVKHFAKLKGTAKIIELVTRNVKTLGTAVKIATLGFNPWVMAIEAVVVGFTMLYKHSKKFRNFVNGLAKTAANGMKSVGRWFKNTFKQIGKNQEQANRDQIKANKQAEKNWRNFTNSLSRNWKSYWRNRDKEQRQNEKRNQQYWNNVRKSASRGWKNMESSARSGVNKVSRWYSNMNRSTSRVIQNMYRQHPKTFQSMYKVIQDRTKVWRDLVTGHWSQLKDDTGRLAKDQSRANKDIFEDMYSAINKKTGGWLGKVVDSWKDHMSQIGDAISNGKKKAGAAMADLANGVLKPFKTLIDDIQGGINWVLDKIGASKLGGSWSAAIPTFATGTAGNRDGLKKSTIGMVNDGAGSHWRELYSYKGQIGAFPNKRNFITFLPKGMSILNGEDSHKFMSAIGLPKFANGVGSFFDSLEKGAADAGDFIDKVIEHPVQALEDIFKKFIKVSTPIKFATNLITSVPAYVAKQAGNWIKKQFEELADPGGSGVERWRPYVIKALAMLHLSSSLVGKVLRQIQTESGGNPKAMGGTDGLADGHAMGLMQVKPGTFAANKLPGHGNIWNGFDNLLAGLNYARKRYGDSLSFLGQGHGYANGGLVNVESLAHVAEGNRPEMIIPLTASKRGRAYQLLSEVMAQFKHEDGPAQPTRDDQSISRKEFMSLESKLDQLISGVQQLVQVGQQQINATINSGNKLGMRANRSTAYTVMARDQRLNDYMSYRR